MTAGRARLDASWPNDRRLKLLRQTALFHGFAYGALRELLSASRLRSVKKTGRLFAENEKAPSGFVLADGVLRFEAGASAAPVYAAPPAVIGETALIVDALRPTTAIAETNAVVIEIPRAAFLRVLAAYPESARHAQRQMGRRLRALVDDLEAAHGRCEGFAAPKRAAR
jgi:CRP-like cAMP-binding protein